MSIDVTPLQQEIDAILADPTPAMHYNWTIGFHLGDRRYFPMRLVSLDIDRLYTQNYGDEVVATVMMGAGDFSHLIYPHRRDLVVTLYRSPMGAMADSEETDREVWSEQFRAILMDTTDVVASASRYQGQTRATANLAEIMTVQFQLTDMILEQARTISVGGVFRNTTTAAAFQYLLTSTAPDMEQDEETKLLGVDFYPPDNTEELAAFVIPHGISLVDVGDYLNRRVGGIYGKGLGYYLQDKYWYVFPPYDLTRFENSLKGLTLINVPENRMPGSEKSYRSTANQLIAMVTGETRHLDSSEQQQLNEGNGVRYADARKIFDGFAQVKDNKALALRAENNNEFLTDKRPSGLKHIKLSDRPITANKFYELSKLAVRQGAQIHCVWENSDPMRLFPGMPTRFMYVRDGEIVTLHGVLIAAQHFITTPGQVLTSGKHICQTLLSIFVERPEDLNSTEESS